MTGIPPAEEKTVAEFSLPSKPGNERLALPRVAEVVAGCGLTGDRLDRLKTAVAEATMNAIEHGNGSRPEIPVDVKVLRLPGGVAVVVTDVGGGRGGGGAREVPDLELKLEGRQGPRGWGLFLIDHMVDEVEVCTDGARHSVRLTMRIEGADEDKGGSHAQHLSGSAPVGGGRHRPRPVR
ncbi:MAG: ATP-binding protein [Acidimicrobiales bacterium]